MYPAGNVDISWHLAILRFPQSDHTVGKPLICLDYSSARTDPATEGVSFLLTNRVASGSQFPHLPGNFLCMKNIFLTVNNIDCKLNAGEVVLLRFSYGSTYMEQLVTCFIETYVKNRIMFLQKLFRPNVYFWSYKSLCQVCTSSEYIKDDYK